MLKKFLILSVTLFSYQNFIAQNSQQQVLKLSKQDVESKFLLDNIDLLAKKLEISQAEAQIIQAKLWPNPSFEIAEVNLWRSGGLEEQPPLIGNWGSAQQISLHLEQEIQTAGKRRKNIELQRLTVEEREREFETILRETKLDLRNEMNTVIMLQAQQEVYQKQIANTQAVINAFKNQLDHGNISKAEYIRLKAAELQFRKDLNDVNKDLQESQKELKTFLNIGEDTLIYITDKLTIPNADVSELQLQDWILFAQENRPEVLLTQTLEKQSQKRLEIEKAERTPNITLGVDYDRAGNIMNDFIGFGVSFDLPIFDRNKGNIKEAELDIQLAKLESKSKKNEITNTIVEAFRNYYQAHELYSNIEADYETELDNLLEAYNKNFKLRNVSLIEYLDFVDAYLDNKNILLETQKELNEQFETLQFAIGKDL